jgi:hypothetical protein
MHDKAFIIGKQGKMVKTCNEDGFFRGSAYPGSYPWVLFVLLWVK